jgi:hypothetical protein
MTPRLLSTAVLLLVTATLAIGCGSDASTTSADVRAVAAAESRFLKESRLALDRGSTSCAGETTKAVPRCLARVEEPLNIRAFKRFSRAIEGILEDGVGPKCAAALEETRSTISSVSSFVGATTHACRMESRH